MMITSDHLKYLQDIVGPNWVSADPCMRDAYAIYYGSSGMNEDGSPWTPRPAAVVLPKTTQEVSEVTRFCNKHGFLVKSFATGWSLPSAPGSEKTILLDLKRMDKIIDIDVKNQIAVIEPYVKAVNLQTELWKLGLNVNVVSCGSNHSVLASVAAAWGYGVGGPQLGYSGRNLLGVEWVMPSGEILTLGSAGDGAGWFTDSGPGPSLRGLIRGMHGTFGSFGTYTKCGVKLYRWDGPAEIEIAGASPRYELQDDLPKKLGVFMLSFPTKQSMADAGYKLGEAEIPYADFRLPAYFAALYSTNNNLDFKALWGTGIFQKIARYSINMAVLGSSEREYEWKMKALKEVLREVGGLKMPVSDPSPTLMKALDAFFKLVDDPMKLAKKVPFVQTIIDKLPSKKADRLKVLSPLYLLLLRNAVNVNGSFRSSQGMFTTVGTCDTWDLGIAQNDCVSAFKQKYIEQGLLVDDTGDLGCGGTYENGHYGYLEGIALYNPNVPESAAVPNKLAEETVKACIDQAFGVPIAGFGYGPNLLFGPHCSNYHLWIDKIRKSLDPNFACDSWAYAGNPGEEKQIVFR